MEKVSNKVDKMRFEDSVEMFQIFFFFKSPLGKDNFIEETYHTEVKKKSC